MRKLIFVGALLLIFSSSYSQQSPDTVVQNTKADYLRKSKSQKIAAFVFLGLGATAFIIAAPGNVSFDALAVLVVFGGIAALSSIPLFISSAKNKKRAMSMAFKNMPVLQIKNSSMAYRSIPAVSLKINF